LPLWDRKNANLNRYRLAYLHWLRKLGSKHNQAGTLDLTLERAALARAQTEKVNIEVDRLRSKSLPKNLVTQVWRMHADAVRATFSELSNNLRILIPILSQDECEIIDREVCEILEEPSGDGLPLSATYRRG
jgi:phage terminase Nu1 subunit (DNA packaging protein)